MLRLLQPDQRQKQKTTKEGTCWCAKHYTNEWKENGLSLSHQKPSLAAYEVSKKVISPLRHNQTVQLEEDGAIQFYRIKFHLRNHSSQVQESLFVSRRRIETKISVLLWWFWNSCLLPCSSRTLRTLSHWSSVTRQCDNSPWITPHLPHWMCVQSSFNRQQWTGTWRSGFKQKTNSILLAHWSKRQRSWISWTYWLLCTTSSAIRAQWMEEASRRGILGWYWPCD